MNPTTASVVSLPTVMVSTEILVSVAANISTAIRARQSQHVGLPQRLQMLLRAERSAPRAFIEDKVLAPMKQRLKGNAADAAAAFAAAASNNTTASTTTPGIAGPNQPALPTTPPTAKELQAGGLTLAKLRQLDAQMTPKTLIGMGVITSWDDCKALGVPDFGHFLDQLGQPAEIARYLRKATGGDHAWQSGFVRALRFDSNVWLTYSMRLTPADLAALGFALGAHLESDARLCEVAMANAGSTWLTRGTCDEWVGARQLSATQYELLIQQRAKPGSTTGRTNGKRQ